MARLISLFFFCFLVASAASTGILFEPGGWYVGLSKPEWTPPNWIFPVAWTILYIVIAVAGWLVWQAEGLKSALIVWGVGLLLNGLWSYLMFGLHDVGLALADLVALWLATLAFIVLAWNVDRRASYLFIPYLLWLTYAGALNGWILSANG